MDVRRRVACLAMILAWPWCSPSAAREVRLGRAPTIEWLVADADVVVRATVDFELPPPVGPWSRASVRSVEKLKGEILDEFEFASRSHPGLLDRYRGREVLLFLSRERRHALREGVPSPCPLTLPWNAEQWAVIGLDGRPDDYAVTMDFAVLRDSESIKGAARAAAAYSAGRIRPKSYWIRPAPFGTQVSKLAHAFGSPGMTLPLDERLERKAREWIKSPNPYCRMEGAVTMRRFRSEENIAALKLLLSDPALIGGQYLVRRVAYEVLISLDVECNKPILVPQ